MQSNEKRTVRGRHGGTLIPFEKGKSGNAKGKEPGTKNFATILRALLEAEDKKQGGNGNAFNIPAAKIHKLMDAKNEAVQLKAVQEALERLEGKVDENVNLHTTEIPKIEITFRDAE